MDNFHAINWYEKQKAKQKESHRKHDITLINRQLNNILQHIEHEIEKDRFQVQERAMNRHLVQSSIWRMGYANNFENTDVAIEQAVFIYLLVSATESIPDYRLKEVEGIMRRFGNTDWGKYGEFNRRIAVIRTQNKEIDLSVMY